MTVNVFWVSRWILVILASCFRIFILLMVLSFEMGTSHLGWNENRTETPCYTVTFHYEDKCKYSVMSLFWSKKANCVVMIPMSGIHWLNLHFLKEEWFEKYPIWHTFTKAWKGSTPNNMCQIKYCFKYKFILFGNDYTQERTVQGTVYSLPTPYVCCDMLQQTPATLLRHKPG